MDKRISDLEQVQSLSNTDVFPVVNGGITKKVTLNQLVSAVPPTETPNLREVCNVGNTTEYINAEYQISVTPPNASDYISSLDYLLITTFPSGDQSFIGMLNLRSKSTGGGFMAQIRPTFLSADRLYTLPNKDGTFAMTSDLPTQLLAESIVDSYIGSRLKPADPNSNGFHFRKSVNGSIGYIAYNSNTGNGAVATNGVGIDATDNYTNNTYIAHFGTGYYIPQLAGQGALMSTKTLFIGAIGVGDIDMLTGADYATMTSKFKVFNNGQLKIGVTPNAGSTADSLLVRDSLGNVKQVAYPTNFIPYTGATADLDLGTYNLIADHILLNLNPSGAGFVEGATQWNNSLGSSETLLKGGNVSLKNGVDLVVRVVNKVVPNTTLTKANYQVVKISGASGQKLAVDLAQANNDSNSADTLGIVTETIATNQEGFILTLGQLLDVNTTGSLQGETWVDGDVLYLSPTIAGRMTNIKPTGATGHIVVLGYVEYAHATQGKIYVKIMNGWELDELHNVFIDNPLDNQVLTYDGTTGLWKNETPSSAGITLTTFGSTGAATLVGNTLNIPIYDSVSAIPLKGTETFRGINYQNNSTNETLSGGIIPATSASTIARNVSGSSYINQQIRKGFYASIVSSGRYIGTRGSALLWYVTGGFKFVCDFGITDTSFASGCRQFYGLAGYATDLTYNDVILVSSIQNIIGVGSDALDANLQIFHNGTTGSATKIDLGSNFPANRTAGAAMTTMYSVIIYNEPNSTNVIYEVKNKETGNLASGIIGTDLPLETQGLNFFASRCMGGGGGVTGSGQFDLSILGTYSI